jgi:hypothetical protein
MAQESRDYSDRRHRQVVYRKEMPCVRCCPERLCSIDAFRRAWFSGG